MIKATDGRKGAVRRADELAKKVLRADEIAKDDVVKARDTTCERLVDVQVSRCPGVDVQGSGQFSGSFLPASEQPCSASHPYIRH
jgi:hypothetical protein